MQVSRLLPMRALATGFLAAWVGLTVPIHARALTPAQRIVLFAKSVATAFVIPQAVHFDNEASYLSTNGAALTSAGTTVPGGDTGATANSSVYYFAFRVRGVTVTSTTPSGIRASTTSSFTDFISPTETASDTSETLPGGPDFVWDNGAGNYGTFRLNNSDASGNTAGHSCNFNGHYPDLQDNAWHSYYGAFSGGNTGSAKFLAVYRDGVLIGQGCTYGQTTAMLLGIASRGWQVRNSVQNLQGKGVMEFGDIIVDWSVAPVCVSTGPITINGISYTCPGGANTMPAAIQALFYSALGSVDFTKVPKVFGHTPQILLTGGPSGYLTNKGTVTNLTTHGTLFTAATGPSSTASGRAYVNWGYPGLITASSTSATTDSGGNSIPQNSLILLREDLTDTSGVTAHNPATPTGFTLIASLTPCGSNNPVTTTIWGKIASASESGAYGLSWTTGNVQVSSWTLYDVQGAPTASVAAAIDAVASQGNGCTTNTTSLTAPTVTPSATNDTLLSLYTGWSNADSLATPAGQDRVVSMAEQAKSYVTATEEYLTTTAATGTRTATVTSDSGNGVNIAIRHN